MAQNPAQDGGPTAGQAPTAPGRLKKAPSAAAAIAALAGIVAWAPAAAAAPLPVSLPPTVSVLTVCPSGCAYTQIAPAVAAASSGDTVSVAAGTYHGGFTIDQNLTLNGAGAQKTIISGGGPVITVGMFGATTEPTVAIRGVTVTGGVTGSSPVSTALVGEAGVRALGGGIFVPPAANFATGATVTISNSVITGNTAAPTTSVDSGIPCPGGDGQCQFAQAGGGGIDNWGTLTVDHTTVSDNESAGPVTSDADGAGIYTQQGALTVNSSIVTGNRDIATVPDGRFAEGAGVMVDFSLDPPGATATLSVQDSVVSNNSASLTSNLPSFYGGALINMNANAGGIHVGTGIPTTVENTAITGNSATATDLQGEPDAIDAGMNVGDSPIVIQNTQIDGNQDTTTSATTADSLPAGDTVRARRFRHDQQHAHRRQQLDLSKSRWRGRRRRCARGVQRRRAAGDHAKQCHQRKHHRGVQHDRLGHGSGRRGLEQRPATDAQRPGQRQRWESKRSCRRGPGRGHLERG